MALTQQQVDQYDVSTGFGMRKVEELQALGATRGQIIEIAARAPIIGDRAAALFPELASWGSNETADLSVIPGNFNWIEYVNANPDLDAAGIDTAEEARRHYAIYGFQENRPNAPAPLPSRDERYQTLRTELENQYKALVKLSPAAAYAGRSSDLNAIFNQQAAQLADAGVQHVGDLQIQNGRLVNKTTGKEVTTSNLGGQVAVDRDTGVLKWGDIFSGVKGGANYGLQELPDGSILFFPAWEKTKSPISQIGLSFLEPVIAPIATIAGTIIGGPVGAGVGNSIGQFLATGEVELEQALQAAAIAYVGGEIADAAGSSAADIGKAVAPAASSATQVAIGEAAIAAGVGAGAAAVTGGDPLTGAVLGAAGSVTSTTYANSVGKSIAPSASASTQTMIGNAAINAGLSGLTAAVTGGDVEKAIMGGAVIGAVSVSADSIASTLVGGEENLAALTAKTNLTETQMADLITRSTTNAILAEITGGDFAETFTQGLVAGGLSTSAANFTASKVGEYVKPEATRAIAAGVKGMTDVAVRATMNGQDVGLALEAALPNLAIATATQYARAKKIEADPKLSQLPQEQKLLLAQLDTGTMSDAMVSGIEPHQLADVVVYANEKKVDPQTLLEQAIDYWDRFSAFLPEAAKPEFDVTIRTLAGIVGGVNSVMGTFGAGTETTETLDQVRNDLIGMLSAESLGDRDRQYEILKEAEGKGTLDQLKAGYEAFMVDPVGASFEAIGSTAPVIAAGAAGLAVGPLTALTAMGTAGGMMGVGELKNEIYKEIYTAARERGLSEADAIQMATAASAYDGPLADQQALAAAIGVVTSVGPLAGMEKALVGDIANLAASRIAGRAALAGIVENLTEAGQAIQQKAATNIGTQRLLDPAEQELALMGEWSEASRAYRDFIEANPWAKDTFEGAVAQGTYEGLSATASGVGLSAGIDLEAKARGMATEQGVEWELLDPMSKSDLMVRALMPQEVIDVSAREVGPLLLKGPEDTTTTLNERDQKAVTDYISGKADIALAAETERLPEYAQDVIFKERTGQFEDYVGDLAGLTEVATDKINAIDFNVGNLLRERMYLVESGVPMNVGRNLEIQDEIDALNLKRENLVNVRRSLTEQTEALAAPVRGDIQVNPSEIATILNLTPEQATKYNLVLPPTGITQDTTPTTTTDPNANMTGVSPGSAPPPGAPSGPTVYPGATIDPTVIEQELAAVNVEKAPLRTFNPKIPPEGDSLQLQFQGGRTGFESVFPEETWLGGRFRLPADAFESVRNLIPQEFPEMQESNVFSALRQASGVDRPGPQTFMGLAERTPSYYSYGTETTPGLALGLYKRGGTVQNKASGGTINMSPLMMAEGSDVPHKGAHHVQGAGGGQDDLIDAKLADGEYVFDAEIVAALGDGSNKEGAKILDRFREEIRKHKRGGSTKSIPPKAKSPLAYLRSVL